MVTLSTDKAAYPVNAMGISKAMMEKVTIARSRVAAEKAITFSATRYGNVMASRGSVIPLFVKLIREGRPLTVTDPNMTRFMMSLDDAVDLVLYSFEHAKPGDLFVQKAPAATIGTLAEALKRLMKSDVPVKVIGSRHGEKLYETLLTREECASAHDLGRYFRVPADNRDLNYDKYFSEGDPTRNRHEDYHSHNTDRLDVDGMCELLRSLPYMQAVLRGETRDAE